MAEVVNLNKQRKKKTRSAKEAAAKENRTKFGRTRQERARDEEADARRRALIDGAKLDDAAHPDDDAPTRKA